MSARRAWAAFVLSTWTMGLLVLVLNVRGGR